MTSEQPVLEVGGSHVTAALVRFGSPDPVSTTVRLPLDSAGDAQEILGTLVRAGSLLDADPAADWAIAFPGPFDYDAGVGLFTGVGKFDALHGVSVRDGLAKGLGAPPGAFHFLNDANAFALGEWALNTPPGPLVCMTLGTGVGSAFVADGVCVVDGDTVPPDAELHLTSWADLPLEDTISSRAIVSAYGRSVQGVREVVEAARNGDEQAMAVLRYAYTSLGCAISPWIDRFGAVRLTVGGSITAAWELIEPLLRAGLSTVLEGPMPEITVTVDTEHSALVGAAFSARNGWSHR